MSEQSQGPGWWLASDGKWYPPRWGGPRFEYKVLEMRETLLMGKNSGAELEKALNGYGAEGWEVRSIVEAKVTGRVGPAGVGGLIVTLQRQIP